MEIKTPLGQLLVKPKSEAKGGQYVAGFEVRKKWRAELDSQAEL